MFSIAHMRTFGSDEIKVISSIENIPYHVHGPEAAGEKDMKHLKTHTTYRDYHPYPDSAF